MGGGRLTEVEAYLPAGDPASHSFRGPTLRNAPMFGAPGSIYVYLSYGVHLCLNLVCDRESVGSAVLIRSFEPLGDVSVLRANRLGGRPDAGMSDTHERLKTLACGPGRLGRALGVHLGLNGMQLGPTSGMYVFEDGVFSDVECTVRIGISKGSDMPLRYVAAASRYVTRSGHRRSRR